MIEYDDVNPDRFDKAYYDRYYRNPSTRVSSPQEVQRQADFIAAYLRYVEVPVTGILDIGCGLGRLLTRLGTAFPEARTHGVESSTYLCAEYGWEGGQLPGYTAGREYDLVVCYDVLSYLEDADAAEAIKTLGRLTRRALFFGALTVEDRNLCDPVRTDTDVYLRSNRWYRRRLGRHFEPVGGGLWLNKPVRAFIWTLDRR